jgi:hypothetical protein
VGPFKVQIQAFTRVNISFICSNTMKFKQFRVIQVNLTKTLTQQNPVGKPRHPSRKINKPDKKAPKKPNLNITQEKNQ